MVDERTYKYELMIAFWLAVELEKVEEARAVVEIDSLIEQVVINLRENGAIMRKYHRKLVEKRSLKFQNFMARADENEEDADGKEAIDPEEGKKKPGDKDYEGIEMNENEELEDI